MKKITINIVMALLCLNFHATAQENTTITPLQIGDRVPDLTIDHIINYPATTAKLSDFKGKLLILDFWATWCSPCVAMIPKMDSLQNVFTGKLQIIPVTYQPEKEVNRLIEKLQKQQHQKYRLPDVTDDKTLTVLFPHSQLPHFVWIDANGIVRAITDQYAITSENIQAMIFGKGLNVAEKKDVKLRSYDRTKPLFSDKNAAYDSASLYRSVFTKYIEGIKPGYHYDLFVPGKTRRITVRNLPILSIFCNAYSGQYRNLGLHHIFLDVKDSTQFDSPKVGEAFTNWARDNHAFSYELIVQPTLAPHIFEIMQADMTKFFPQYNVKIETISRSCWVLTRTSTIDKIHSSGGQPLADADRFGFHLTNATLDYLLIQLDTFYLSGQPYPVIDATGYKGKVDLVIEANLGKIDAINKALEKYDLKFVFKQAPVEVLHISDSQSL
jgi:thiol-disulfide isomerase/thioredoxin